VPIGDLQVPVIGKNVVIAVLVQTHILFATFIIGAVLIAATSEYLGMVTKQNNYERFARNLARFVVLLFASGAALAITFVLALITLFPVFVSGLQNIFFWVFLVEAFMFLGQIIIVYAWYNVWDKLAYRKSLHVVFGFVAGFFGVMAMTMIDSVASFMLTQPIIGYGYLKGIRESSPDAFHTLMIGSKSWLFNLLVLWLTIMSVASTAYFVHKLRFAVKPVEFLRKLCVGALGFIALFTSLTLIPKDGNLVPQIGLVVLGGEQTTFPLGSMYPWKFIGLIGLMLVGVFVLALYLRVSATGFYWGRASRWSQYALIACAVTVVLTMMTMGYTRETARRVDNDPGYLIYNCITLEQEITPTPCPAGDSIVGGK